MARPYRALPACSVATRVYDQPYNRGFCGFVALQKAACSCTGEAQHCVLADCISTDRRFGGVFVQVPFRTSLTGRPSPFPPWQATAGCFLSSRGQHNVNTREQR